MLEVEGNNLRGVALDGYRLAFIQKPVVASSGKIRVVVPARSLNEVSKILEDSDDIINVYIHQNNLVKFDIKERNMVISSNSEIGNIKENINVVLDGKELNIAFNASYFMDALRVLSDEFITINFNSWIFK